MFNYSLLENIFSNRVAFRQVRDECTPKIHPNLLVGRVFVDAVRDAKVYLQPEMIYKNVSGLEPKGYTNVVGWEVTTPYVTGQRVKYNDGTHNFVYYATADSTGETPIFDSDFWETDLSYYLRQARKDSINEALASVQIENNTDKFLRSTMQFANYFEERNIYTDFNSTDFRLRYLRLSIDTNRHLKLTINKLGVKTDTAQTLTFYLFHSSQPNAIKTFDIVLQEGFKWYELEEALELSYLSDNNSKGVFMLGFYEDEIVGSIQVTDGYIKYLGRDNHLFNGCFSSLDGANMSDRTESPTLSTYYGLLDSSDAKAYFNFQYSIDLDYTYAVQQAPQMFDKFIQYDTALRIILDSHNSSRKNPDKVELNQRFDFILNDGYVEYGQFQKKSQVGLSGEVENLKEQLKINMNYQGGEPFRITFG